MFAPLCCLTQSIMFISNSKLYQLFNFFLHYTLIKLAFVFLVLNNFLELKQLELSCLLHCFVSFFSCLLHFFVSFLSASFFLFHYLLIDIYNLLLFPLLVIDHKEFLVFVFDIHQLLQSFPTSLSVPLCIMDKT